MERDERIEVDATQTADPNARPYSPPKLTVHGTVAKLTASGSRNETEGGTGDPKRNRF